MKKFISAVTSLCMAATMVSVAVPSVSAADASKGFAIKTYAESGSKYAASGSNVTISAADIAAGDVVVPCAVYLDEATADSQALSVQLTVNSSNDVSGVKFDLFNPTDNYFSADQTFTLADGSSFSTKRALCFAGSYDDFDGYLPAGTWQSACEPSQSKAGTDNYYIGYSWTNGGYSYKWLGNKSDDHPLFVFNVTIPKGAAAGDYTIDYCDYNTDSTGKNDNPSCMVETDSRYTSKLGNLKLDTMKITVEGSSSNPTTTTTTKPVTTTTTTKPVTPPVEPSDADFVFDFGNHTAKAGDTLTIPVLVHGGSNPVTSMDVIFKIDSPLTISRIGGSTPAYGSSTVTSNMDIYAASFMSLDSSGEGLVAEDGATVFNLQVKIPADCADGTYKIGFDSKCEIYKDNTSFNYSTSVKNGSIVVGNGSSDPGTTTTTTKPVTPPVEPSDADFVFDFGNHTAKAGDTLTIPVLVHGGSNPVTSMDVIFKIDSPLTISRIGGSTPAYGSSTVTSNMDIYAASFMSLDSSGEGLVAEDGATVFNLQVKIPADCADGTYKIGFDSKCEIYKDNTSFNYSTAVENGNIVVGNGTEPGSTTTTTKPVTTSTTTTTTPITPPVDDKYTPDWGDANCDGTVNVADVVVLNKWLNDNASYNLTAQGKVNADCYAPQDANGGAVSADSVDLTAADSDAIIKFIVHLLTLPVQG